MTATTETKSDVKDKKPNIDSRLTVKVRDNNGGELIFKIKKTTRFEKVMAAYVQRMQGNPETYRFMFDGKRINKNETPEMLEMEDLDVIDVALPMIGGSVKV
eukprot:Plantae.Rhodophyta-Hildenbrandia_rubra.ctg5597.p1 GENE.Plantae.Rhodophyta-Hildenbrandia_rubra.ctg5597~~Plantae.Rhodophyta-Hildenbrandia_rubra.ctg5597.p1  ORF type:complete len:102 (-),score=19.68 Plantae.Rhodophyta-Hildenbrandia_rubra.ctg5597:367-672(-)